MNPMVRKELQQRMRERRGWIVPSIYLLIIGAAAIFAYFTTAWRDQAYGFRTVQGSEVGAALFLTVVYGELGVLLLLAPIFSAGSITIEKEQKTIAGLLTSLLTPFQIWWGKFVSSIMFVALLLIATTPLLAIGFAFGGFGAYEAAMALVTTLIILITVSSLGLLFSAIFRRSVHATAASYGAVVLLAIITAIIFAMIESVVHQSWTAQHWYVKLPVYFNPFFFVTTALAPIRHLWPNWVACLGIYVVIIVLSAFGTLFYVRRSET